MRIESDMISISEHAYNRAKERLGLNRPALRKLCAMAYCYGVAQSQTKGLLLSYLKQRKVEYPNNTFRIYGENLFVFQNNVLVTAFRLPNEVNKPQFFTV